ncbi:50S ribosomal protein L25 [Clostridium sardiniense]|uniref:50S ribosomal protein L25 n=1 Tax=Clostridium sardiniense TaxID=29369 RepID=UPI003D32FB92
MNEKAFKISKRKSNEKTNRIRREGQIPCIIYGESLSETIPVKIPFTTLLRLFKENTRGSIIPLDVGGEIKNCVVKDIQKNNLGEVIHVDFQSVEHNEIVKMKIPVNFLGEESLESKNLIFEICTPTLEFHGNVEKIPELIEYDISGLNFEDKVFAKDICIPSGVELVTDPDTILAVVNS